MVRTHVLLVNEDVNVKGMTKALRATKVPEWTGEVSQLQEQIPDCTSSCYKLIIVRLQRISFGYYYNLIRDPIILQNYTYT